MEADHDPFVVAERLDWTGKWWWGASLVLKFGGFAAGAVAIISSITWTSIPYIVASLAIVAELAQLRSDIIRGTAQGLRRKLDLQDSLGWQMSHAEFSDLLVRCPWSVRTSTSKKKPSEAYFASNSAPGPQRALENVQESAWWSKHLAYEMFSICFAVLIVTALGSIVALITSIEIVRSTSGSSTQPVSTATIGLSTVSRLVTSILMLMISLGLNRLTISYFAFYRKAQRVEESAERLLTSKQFNVDDATKHIQEYHLARAAAPALPHWLWALRKSTLNQLWNQWRSQRP